MKKCPYCAEEIKEDAVKCKHCGEFLDGSSKNSTISNSTIIIQNKKSKGTAAILAIFLGGLGIHKFYLNSAGWGIVYLLFCWTLIPAFIGFLEGIAYAISSDEDFDARYNKLQFNNTKQNTYHRKEWHNNRRGLLIIIIVIIFIYGLTLISAEIFSDSHGNKEDIIFARKRGDNIEQSSESNSNQGEKSNSPVNFSQKESSTEQNEIAIIRDELVNIPKDEYGEEPTSPCRNAESPGGKGYYMVGTELKREDDLAIAVYNARKYCASIFSGINRNFCKTGIDMAIRNVSNLQECYKEIFGIEIESEIFH